MSTIEAPPDLPELTARQRQVWSTGDYSVIATLVHPVSERLVDDADLHAGWRVLDVATGTGNAAIAAARQGCEAVGIDYVPALLQRAASAPRPSGWTSACSRPTPTRCRSATASSTPRSSVFGVMFAADPVQAARELVRVVRPGGTIALASWTPTGFVGEIFRVMTSHVPSLVRVPSPFVWGTEPGLRSLLAPDLAYLQLRRRTFTFRARSPEHFVEMFRKSYGPTVRAFEAAGPDRFLLKADLLDLVRERNRLGDGTVAIPATYLEAIATRR